MAALREYLAGMNTWRAFIHLEGNITLIPAVLPLLTASCLSGIRSETCSVVETMFSLEVSYQIFGSSPVTNAWADQIEKLGERGAPNESL